METMSALKKTFVYVGNWNLDKASTGCGFGIFRYNTETGDLELINSVFDLLIMIGK